MTGAELGFLLLGSHLGDLHRPCLTPAQLGDLRHRMQIKAGTQPGEDYVDQAFLASLGYEPELCGRILRLLSQKELAGNYLERGRQAGYHCLTRCSPQYPEAFRVLLGERAPAVLWYSGDQALLHGPAVSLVGSRDATEQALEFAAAAGSQAARQNYTLISGGARGCDRVAQQSCLQQGGRVVCILADGLCHHEPGCGNLLYLCEDSYDLPFSAARALSRNLLIHTLGQVVLVAQCGVRGGTWSGTTQNLRHGWRPVCFNREDGPMYQELVERGAVPVGLKALEDYGSLTHRQLRLFPDC